FPAATSSRALRSRRRPELDRIAKPDQIGNGPDRQRVVPDRIESAKPRSPEGLAEWARASDASATCWGQKLGGGGGGGEGGGGEGRSEEECEHRVLAEVAACQKVKTINLLQIASASVPALAKRHFQESVLLRGPWSSMKRWPKNF
ncbi:unnamed protein product, partial [Prorocentrum cordatum]